MALKIEDYALIGDCETAALVGNNGSIDWLCFPRFDSAACFAALLGDWENGHWSIAPRGAIKHVQRKYRDATLILETEFETEQGRVRLTDFMSPRGDVPDVVRIVEGLEGKVDMEMDLVIRFDYGAVVPWVRTLEDGLWAVAGPDTLHLRTPVETYGKDFHTRAEFTVAAGDRIPWTLYWLQSHKPALPEKDPEEELRKTETFWRDWSSLCTYQGPWREQVLRSLITLKALTYAPTGGIIAAATTSLPEKLGGVRNWDYRYCWLRDATFTLYALMTGGYRDEARDWREWLLRAAAGKASQMHIMYGVAGERRLTELELDWLSGYENSKPVRIGNGAWNQFQLDVYGEVMDALHVARRNGLEPSQYAWQLQTELMTYLEAAWRKPDEGIWEVRGPRRHFTHSKVMAWVAFDRAVKAVECFGLEGPVEKWKALRDEVHDEVCREGFNRQRNSFVQYYGADHLDASLLMIPLVGFLPPDDPRVIGTVRAIEQDLLRDGFVERYPTQEAVDGLPPGEGAFLMTTFWYIDNLALQGRYDDARREFERLLGLCNDVGLLAEEYDTEQKRLLGNFPQAFSHVGIINTARNLARHGGPAEHRTEERSEYVC